MARWRVVILLMAAALAPSSRAVGQEPGSLGTISGRVVDASTMGPLEGALVRLQEPEPEGATLLAAAADSRGEYRFASVPPGVYRIRISRLGYLPTEIEVELISAAPTRISMGLEVEPVRLAPLSVRTRRPPPFLRGPAAVDSGAMALRLSPHRRPEHLMLDVRALTHTDVVEAVTLAETDLFRALQRTPGVATRDDFTATLWTRGASWDQTRVYLDGLPLYNPTHAGWLFSAVNPDALGDVVFYPGARPARFGEGAAAVLDLRSRSGSGEGVRGRGELSLASARMALDGGSAGGEVNWMVAGRRTYVDMLSRVAGEVVSQDRLYVPYDFSDVVGRVDGRISGIDYEVSGILEQDHLRGRIPGVLQGNRGWWGNRAATAAVGVPLGPLRVRIGGGETRFRASVLRDERSARGDEPTLPPLESEIRHRAARLELTPDVPQGATPAWTVGIGVFTDSVGYEGPFSLLGELAVVLPRDSVPLNNLILGSRLRYGALWLERRINAGPLALETGVRIESGDSVMNGGSTRVAPRLAASLAVDADTRLSAGWSRAWQYTQDIAPVAGPLGPQLHLTHLWVLAQGAGFAAVRSDVMTAGVERWVGDRWLIGINGYDRRSSGVEVPNPESGRIVPDRDPSVGTRNRARGVELLARRLGERWSGSVGYTYGRSTLYAELPEPEPARFVYPASADVRHAVDAMLSIRVAPALRVGGAFTYGSGVPYTRLVLPARGTQGGDVVLGDAHAERTPAYASLDLTAEYVWSVGSWDVTAYGQIRNALGRRNAVTYSGSMACDPGVTGCPDGFDDRFEPGIPRLPLVGVRFAF